MAQISFMLQAHRLALELITVANTLKWPNIAAESVDLLSHIAEKMVVVKTDEDKYDETKDITIQRKNQIKRLKRVVISSDSEEEEEEEEEEMNKKKKPRRSKRLKSVEEEEEEKEVDDGVVFYDVDGAIVAAEDAIYVCVNNTVVFPGAYICVKLIDGSHHPILVESFSNEGLVCWWFVTDTLYRTDPERQFPLLEKGKHSISFCSVVAQLSNLDVAEREELMDEYLSGLTAWYARPKTIVEAWTVRHGLEFHQADAEHIWLSNLGGLIRATYIEPFLTFGVSHREDLLQQIFKSTRVSKSEALAVPRSGQCDACRLVRTLSRVCLGNHLGVDCASKMDRLTAVRESIQEFQQNPFQGVESLKTSLNKTLVAIGHKRNLIT